MDILLYLPPRRGYTVVMAQLTISEIGRRGALAAHKKRTKKQRSELARKAANKRWANYRKAKKLKI